MQSSKTVAWREGWSPRARYSRKEACVPAVILWHSVMAGYHIFVLSKKVLEKDLVI